MTMRKLWMTSAIVAILSTTAAFGDSLPSTVRALLQEYARTRDSSLLVQFTQTDNVSFYIFDRFVQEQMPQRIGISGLRKDLHLGSFNPSSASTSVVTRPGASDLLSAAMESGAVARKSDDKSVTISVNALPVYQILNGRMPLGCGTVEEDCRQGVGRWVRGLSTSASFNTSDSTTPIPDSISSLLGGASGVAGFFTGSNKVLSLSARYEFFVRERRPKEAQALLDEAAGLLTAKAKSFLESQSDFETRLQAVLGTAGTPGWTSDTLAALRRNSDSLDKLAEVLLAKYRLAYDLVQTSPQLQQIHTATVQEKLKYITAQNKVLAEKLYRKAFTLDYVQQRPTDQPWLHDVRVVMSTPIGRKPNDETLGESRAATVPSLTLVLNGGVSLYQHLPAGINHGRTRSAQTSLALDWSPSHWGAVKPTYTVAYYFQYMIENGVIEFNKEAITPGGAKIPLSAPATEILNTKGPIHVGQVRLSIPLGTSGVSFPVAASFSSRTEFITGRSFWQGHVGVSYDLSRLKAFLQSNGTP
jgi:hypothetical protein